MPYMSKFNTNINIIKMQSQGKPQGYDNITSKN